MKTIVLVFWILCSLDLGFDVDLRLWIRGRDRKEGNEDDYHLIRDGDTHTKDITCVCRYIYIYIDIYIYIYIG